MKNEFTAIIERDGEWYIAFCPEIPEANGQGKTKDEARENLAEAIGLILEDRLLGEFKLARTLRHAVKLSDFRRVTRYAHD